MQPKVDKAPRSNVLTAILESLGFELSHRVTHIPTLMQAISKDKKNTSKGKYKVILFVNDNASLFECGESTVIEYINNL